MVFIAVLTGAFSLGAWRTGIVPRWVSGSAWRSPWPRRPAPPASTLNSAILYGFWFGGMFGWVLWYAIVGITLGLRTRADRRAGTETGDADRAMITHSGHRESYSER